MDFEILTGSATLWAGDQRATLSTATVLDLQQWHTSNENIKATFSGYILLGKYEYKMYNP